MTWFYARWAVMVIVVVGIASLTSQHYQQNLASLSPRAILSHSPAGTTVRVQGMVKSGTLKGHPEEGHAQFELVDGTSSLAVDYDGPPPENLRELKTLVLIGQWDSDAQMFRAHEIALVTNYGFVVSAYLVALMPLSLFLFAMSRRVSFLFQEIKQSKLYEAE